MNVPQMDVYEWICAGALLWLVALCVWMCCPRRKEIVPDWESSLFPNQRQAGQDGAERATHYVCVSKATIRKTRNKKSKRVVRWHRERGWKNCRFMSRQTAQLECAWLKAG